jgi:protein-tyrosine phosphatase
VKKKLKKMFVLKKKIQLKIAIPKNKEEEKNKALLDNNNNRSSLSKITENIYTSGYLVAKDISFLLKNNFTHVINCSRGSSMETSNEQSADANNYDKSPSIKYLPIFLRDDPGADIINCFFQTIDFIESKEESNRPKKILIHCIEGISRAPALIAGYLMWKQNLRTENAIEYVKSHRKCVDINLGFIIQLHKWENYLFSPPEKIHIFKLCKNIRLLDEKEYENENYSEIEHLIRFNRKLFYIKNNRSSEHGKLLDEINKLNVENCDTFNENNDKIKFICNVIKYDKLLLNNDIDSLVEINYNDLSNNRFSFEDLIKINNAVEQ